MTTDSTPRKMTDVDRGAVLALALLLRADEVHEGEEDWTVTANDISDAIQREGLPATIRLQMDAETDFFADDLYEPFPTELAEVAKGAPKTTWRP